MTTPTPVRIGIVGLGRAGWGMHCEELQTLPDRFRVVAVCDELPERRRNAAVRFGCATYECIEELVRDPQVELVDICTRSCDHFRHGSLALRAGKSVNMEKPMCATYAEAARLVKVAGRSSGQLFIRHNRRFEPGFQHVREIIESGLLGEVFEVKLRRVGYQRRDDWQTLKQFGGGQLLNWGPHIVDHALRLLGAPVAQVWSYLRRVAAVGDAEDHLKILLTGSNGRLVDLEISGGASLGEPEYLVWGDKGALESKGDSLHLRYLDPAKPLAPRRPDPGTPGTGFGTPDELPWIEKTLPVAPALEVNMNTTIWEELYRAMREGGTYPIKLEEALDVMRVIAKVRRGTEFA